MKKLTAATIAAAGLAAVGLGLAVPALADGTVVLPPGGPATIYAQDQITGGADPYTPFGTNPDVPYGVWTR